MAQEITDQPVAVIQAIDTYHRMGPMADPAELPQFTLETQAATILSMGKENEPLQWLARQARSDRVAQMATPDQALEAASMMADSLYSAEPATISEGRKSTLLLGIQNSLLKPAEKGSRAERAEAVVRNFDVTNWFERNNEPLQGAAEHGTRAVKAIEKILALRSNPGTEKFGDGLALEMTVSMMLQYKLWQMEMDEPHTYARMATRREDQPAVGMSAAEGRDVAHDVVLQLGDKTVRIQTKQGDAEKPNTSEEIKKRFERTYDERLIVMVREKAGGDDLDAILSSVKRAYEGDPKAATYVDDKLREYNLLSTVTAPLVPRATGSVALLGAVSS